MLAKGLIAFPITPIDEAGRVDIEALQRLVSRLVDAEVDAVCVLGSTGSYPFLSQDERRRAVEAAAAVVGRTPLMAGIGALRTDHAVQHAQDAAAAGAVLGLLAPMSYTPLTDDEVVVHFETVAQEGGLPICIYDNPAATHFSMTDAVIERLAAIPGVVALKTPSVPADQAGARIERLRVLVPPGFSIGFSVDAGAAETMIAGADAWYSVLGGLFPAPVMAIRNAVAAGHVEEARRLNLALQPVWDLFQTYSGLRVTYAAARQLGLCETQPPRPILPLPPETQTRVAVMLEELGPLLGPPL